VNAVLDASFFFAEYPAEGTLFTAPSVLDEVKDAVSRCRVEGRVAEGLVIREADPACRKKVLDQASRTGDRARLSLTDVDVLALALELQAPVYTDDFSLENVAHALGILIIPLRERAARPIRWKFRCSGCGRYARAEGECPVCGAAVKRKRK
jgi:UPF0271 protein